ncbi:hypothetical protein DPEC_G00178600 [Dallia pectoralis]|uniref:Uncharacterized protein n=1 Tax=Dallia pectoralis TaxID=75939 RepID=A0ACC2GFP8_DALPE|nr:hypothetical protein DPEC_G00178600 [Dallia pectoralis]
MGEAIISLVETLKRLGIRISDTARPAEVPRLPEEVALPSSPPGTRGMNFLRPAAYDGAAERCQGFLLQLELYFEDLSPAPSDRQKVVLITCLSGKALFWANAIWSGGGSDLRSYRTFSDYFRSVFDKPPDGREVGERLALLRQGKRSVQEFALEFRTLAAGVGWNERAYIDIFRVRLNPEVRREMACKDATLSFEELVELAIKLDNLLNARGRSGPGPVVPLSSTVAPEPMELGGAASRETARPRECTFCGRKGHSASHCYRRVERTREGRSDTPVTRKCKALVDSGAAGDFMDQTYASTLQIPVVPLACARAITGLDSRPLVLGMPWLSRHNPQFAWPQRTLTGWSRECQGRCLGVSVGATSVESPDSVSSVRIPPEYSDLALVFSKQLATKLPPHRPGDCAIELQVGAVPPYSHVYPLSQAETQAMETYVSESLKQGMIRHSTSSASSSIFFVKKKDGVCDRVLTIEPLTTLQLAIGTLSH